MKNFVAATAAVATLFAGTAAFAEGGYANDYSFVGAGTDPVKVATPANDADRTVGTKEISEHGRKVIVPVTVYDNAVKADANGFQGR